jgi:transcriptional antiterminator NusG
MASEGMTMKWYVVHTYSGHENKAKLSLLDRVRQAGMDARFGNVLIPTDTVVELVKGQKRSTTRKFFPGYMFVQMEMDQETFHLVKNTPKITGFLVEPTRSLSRRVKSRFSPMVHQRRSKGFFRRG